MKSCLIVDDSKVVRTVARKILEDLDFEIVEAADGQAAMDECNRRMPDAILLDWNMPVMNGIEMIKQMKQNAAWKEIPVVIVTTDGSTKRVAELKDMGVVAYIRKPFKPEDIRNVVGEILGKHHES